MDDRQFNILLYQTAAETLYERINARHAIRKERYALKARIKELEALIKTFELPQEILNG